VCPYGWDTLASFNYFACINSRPTEPPPTPPPTPTFADDDDGDDDDDFGATVSNSGSACDADHGSPLAQELGGELNPGESRLLMHAKTTILGLEAKVCIEIAKSKAIIRMEGSLFNSFIEAYFRVDVAFKKPRNFRLQGGVKMESKEKVLEDIRKAFTKAAEDADKSFDDAKDDLEDAKGVAKAELSKAQGLNDLRKQEWNDAADDLRDKAADWQAKKDALDDKLDDLDDICQLRCCTKACVPRGGKRAKCKLANIPCHTLRAPAWIWINSQKLAVSFAQGIMGVAAEFVDAASGIFTLANQGLEFAKEVCDAAISIAQGICDGLKALVGWGLDLLSRMVNGFFENFYLHHFTFDLMMSKDSKYLAVSLDLTLFGHNIDIDFTLDFNSIGAAIKSLINAIVQIVKGLLGFRRERHSRGIDGATTGDAFAGIPTSEWYGKVRRYARKEHMSEWMGHESLRSHAVHRRSEDATDANTGNVKLETVCSGTCECKACLRSVKNLINQLHSSLFQTKTATLGVKRAAQRADRESSLQYRERVFVEAIQKFKVTEKARRAEQKKLYPTVEGLCAGKSNTTACIYINNEYDVNLEAFAVDNVTMHQYEEGMATFFGEIKSEAKTLHTFANIQETSGWLGAVKNIMHANTINGIGCPEVECVGLHDCITRSSTYVSEMLFDLTDSSLVCPSGFNNDKEGCDEAARFEQESLKQLARKWDALVAGMSNTFSARGKSTTATLSDAVELVDKARAVVASLSPVELCENTFVVPDTSQSTHQNNTNLHGGSTTKRADAPTAAKHNQLHHQVAEYSSLCGGSAAVLTDGVISRGSGSVFVSCDEDRASISIRTQEPAYISTVRVGKQCDNNNDAEGTIFDSSVAGLQIKIKTSLGIFNCGKIADASDAACDAEGSEYWERQCDIFEAKIVSTAVIIVREAACTPPSAAYCTSVAEPTVRFLLPDTATPESPSGSYGKLVLNEVQAQGRPMAVSNVLLGQRASSTSQCHERPTYYPLDQYGTQFPSMEGSVVFDVDSKEECMDACQAETACIGVSYIVTDLYEKCAISPSPLLSDNVVWKNLNELKEDKDDEKTDINPETSVASHFVKSIPLRRLVSMTNHSHDGKIMSQSCVEDIAGCKYRCALDMRCTGFTFYGNEDDPYSPSVCAMVGTEDDTKATTVFADGPFAQLPAEGISANIGRPPRLHEHSEFTSTQNYAILLGLDKLTDGLYQPLSADGGGLYSRQGFLHTCGLTFTDEVVIPTTEPSRVYTVRVFKRCDCCEHRAVGLQVMQQVVADETTGELVWQACGGISAEDDAVCADEGSPGQQFWERNCDHTVDTRAIKVVRVSNSKAETDDLDFRAIDLPEIEAFGATFLRASDASSDAAEDEDESEREDATAVFNKFNKATVVKTFEDTCIDESTAPSSEDDVGESEVVYTDMLMSCTVSTTFTSTTTATTTTTTTTSTSTTTVTTTTVTCNGAVDPEGCNDEKTVSWDDCEADSMWGRLTREKCPVRCNSCIATTSTTIATTTTTATATTATFTATSITANTATDTTVTVTATSITATTATDTTVTVTTTTVATATATNTAATATTVTATTTTDTTVTVTTTTVTTATTDTATTDPCTDGAIQDERAESGCACPKHLSQTACNFDNQNDQRFCCTKPTTTTPTVATIKTTEEVPPTTTPIEVAKPCELDGCEGDCFECAFINGKATCIARPCADPISTTSSAATTTVPPTTASSTCKGIGRGKICRAMAGCSWNKVEKMCSTLITTIPTTKESSKTDCALITRGAKCRNTDGCSWEKDASSCFGEESSPTTTEAATTPTPKASSGGCALITRGAKCRNTEYCTWDKDANSCSGDAVPRTTTEPATTTITEASSSGCALITRGAKCRNTEGCTWDKDASSCSATSPPAVKCMHGKFLGPMDNTRARTEVVGIELAIKDAEACGMYCALKGDKCQSFSYADGHCLASTSNNLEEGTEIADGFTHYWRSKLCPE
jgi:hypothetical protein